MSPARRSTSVNRTPPRVRARRRVAVTSASASSIPNVTTSSPGARRRARRSRAVRVVDVRPPRRVGELGREQARLRLEVRLDVAVVVEVVVREVREARPRRSACRRRGAARARATTPPSRRWSTPASRIRASSAWSSVASGVVCSSGTGVAVDPRAGRADDADRARPAARAIASSRYVVVVLPFVPVTPRHAQRPRRVAVEARPADRARARGARSGTSASADARGRAGARPAARPRRRRPRPARASWPSVCAPGMQAKQRAGRTWRLSCVSATHVDVGSPRERRAPRRRPGAPAAARARSSPPRRSGAERQGTGPSSSRHGRVARHPVTPSPGPARRRARTA